MRYGSCDFWPCLGVRSDALKRIRKVKLLPDDRKQLRYLSYEECHTLIDACDSHLRPIVVTALNTGMRKGELLNLKWDNVEFKHGFILQHTFASHLVMAGVDLTTVKELLEHKTPTMTLRYAHFAPAHKVKAVDILDGTLNGGPIIQKLYNQKEKRLAANG